jgi:hypothetical protein
MGFEACAKYVSQTLRVQLFNYSIRITPMTCTRFTAVFVQLSLFWCV